MLSVIKKEQKALLNAITPFLVFTCSELPSTMDDLEILFLVLYKRDCLQEDPFFLYSPPPPGIDPEMPFQLLEKMTIDNRRTPFDLEIISTRKGDGTYYTVKCLGQILKGNCRVISKIPKNQIKSPERY
jgi:hypothetical protein